MRYLIASVVTISLFLIMSGCSSGSNMPLTPQADESSDYTNTLGVLGVYELNIDTDNFSAELVAKRTSAIGESYVVSGISFFTIQPCPDCFKISSIGINADGNIVIAFLISHPFEPGDPLKPPSGINRLDLDIFDLALVIVPQEMISNTYLHTNVSVYTDFLSCFSVDADGYTTELANLVLDNAALPYYLVVDESGETSHTYNEFAMGAKDVEFESVFDLSNGNATFDLYLTMGYGFSAVKADRLTPAYYNPEFNRKSAWKVVVTPPEGGSTPEIGNTWDDVDDSTTHNVTVEVYDWQIGANVDPALANPTDIYSASGVARVSAEIASMNSSLQFVTTPDSGTGAPDDPLVFTIPIANEFLLTEGVYIGLVKVTDERAVGTVGDRDFLIDNPDGITNDFYDLPEFATYQTFTATVVSGYVEPTYHWEFDDFLTFVTPSPPMNPPSEDFDVLSPALCEEHDGNLGMMLAANDILLLNPGLSFITVKYRSSDDGDTYTYLGMPEYGGSTGWATDKCKIFPSATSVAYGTYSWGSNYGYIAPLVSGAMHRGFSAGRPTYNMESLVDIHGWVYCLSDSASEITIKHSPNQLFTGDENWWPYTQTTITTGNILSHVRSIDLGDGEDIFLAVFSTDRKVISLCHNTDSNPVSTWDDSTVVYDGGSDYYEVRDPSLHVESGNICHIVYTRRVVADDSYQLVYTSDDASFNDPTEVVIREQAEPFNDATIGYGHPLGLDVVTISYESNGELYLISSFDGGLTFSEPEIVSPAGSSNRDPDMLIDADDGHLHMVWAYLDGTNHDIGRRNAVLVED